MRKFLIFFSKEYLGSKNFLIVMYSLEYNHKLNIIRSG